MSNNKAFKVKNGLELQEYAKSISDTAVDVFVYDTRKDSDGGAWRKRTQHTSWYNEDLNTATRGSRKEFPAVAVIVAESNRLTIYDGDDPDLPMWMVFTEGRILAQSGSYPTTGVTALNGILAVSKPTYGVSHVNFISERVVWYHNGAQERLYLEPISGRGSSSGATYTTDATPIVNNNGNDVAMTVLPNAPIDAATGLPVPTIAVATDGGISVITDSGAVYDVTESSGPDSTHAIEFTDDNKIVFMWSDTSGINDYPHIGVMPIPSSDQSSSYYYSSTFIEEDYSYNSAFANSNEGPVVVPSAANTRDFKALARNKSCGYDSGLAHIYSNPSDARRSMVAYTTSSYNTGWMNGDIKLATLSDTDDTNVTGSELVTNGTFDTDTSGWTAGDPASGLSVVSQALRLTNNDATPAYVNSSYFTTVPGKTYTLSLDVTVASDGSRLAKALIVGQTSGILYDSGSAYAVGSHSVTFTADDTSTQVLLSNGNNTTSGGYFDFDNISVRLAEEDRSVNGNGLQVFGTVTKSAVATGADLVGYSGFSSSNYLRQPYNSDLNVGTGDICVMGWAKNSGSLQRIVYDRHDISTFNAQAGGSKNRIYLVQTNTEEIEFTLGSTTHVTNNDVWTNDGIWHQVVCLRRNGIVELWFDGQLKLSEANTTAVNADDQILLFGTGVIYPTAPWDGSLALWRISATAPTPEQIKKIYEDEKVLFQEGAQATLYGASDAVTALAYDDTTELLHVGTSAGRSVFQGLRRVDNTTTAVGAAISASNGLVAED